MILLLIFHLLFFSHCGATSQDPYDVLVRPHARAEDIDREFARYVGSLSEHDVFQPLKTSYRKKLKRVILTEKEESKRRTIELKLRNYFIEFNTETHNFVGLLLSAAGVISYWAGFPFALSAGSLATAGFLEIKIPLLAKH